MMINQFSTICRYVLAFSVLPFLLSAPVWAEVSGGKVTSGTASITSGDKHVEVHQTSDKAIIQWDRFNIDADASVHFVQPSSQSVTLNRILDSDPSTILGSLSATGRLFLVNPNGILFGSGAVVDVSGLVATTIDISDQAFEAGHYDFSIPGSPDGYVVNQGTITAQESGMVAMVAPWVRNDGIISARLGQVALASAETFTLDMYGDGLVQIAVDDAPAAPLLDENGQQITSLVENSGTISAEGGQVFLTARSAGAFVDRAIDMSGVIEATSLVERNGEIILAGGDEGDVRVTGTLDASAAESGASGGIVKVSGERVGLFGDALVNVSGDIGGGRALIGGAYQGGDELRPAEQTQVGPNAQIIADAGQSGDGGQVVVWADGNTYYYGSISARGGEQAGDGGQVEVSGKQNLAFLGAVDTSAPNGSVGKLLLDPTDALVVAAADAETTDLTAVDEFADPDLGGDENAKISVDAIESAVADVTVQATRDLTVNEQITMQNANVDLILTAKRNLKINAEIWTAGGNFTAESDADNDGNGTTQLNVSSGGSNLHTFGGNITFNGNVELLDDYQANSAGGNIIFNDSISGDYQLYLLAALAPKYGNVTLKGNTDIGDFLVDGFNNFDSNGTTLEAGALRFYGGTGYIRVGYSTGIANGNMSASGNIDISPDSEITLSGAFEAAGDFTAMGLGVADNVILNILGDAYVELQQGTIGGSVVGTDTVVDTNGGGDVVNNVNSGGGGGGGSAGGGNANITDVVDVVNALSQVDEAYIETTEPQSENRNNRSETDDESQTDSGRPADPTVTLTNGRAIVFAADGTKIGEITPDGSGKDLITTMQNAGYTPDQIADVFVQAAKAGVTCTDVAVTADGNSVTYQIGGLSVTLCGSKSENPKPGTTLISTSAGGFTEIELDGTRTEHLGINHTITTRSDGTVIEVDGDHTTTTTPGGKQTTTWKDEEGVDHTVIKEGNTETHLWGDSKQTTVTADDGTKTVTVTAPDKTQTVTTTSGDGSYTTTTVKDESGRIVSSNSTKVDNGTTTKTAYVAGGDTTKTVTFPGGNIKQEVTRADGTTIVTTRTVLAAGSVKETQTETRSDQTTITRELRDDYISIDGNIEKIRWVSETVCNAEGEVISSKTEAVKLNQTLISP